MKYSYKVTHKNGMSWWSIQKYLFTDEEMLNAFKKEDDTIESVTFHRHIPNGWHLCSCGNLVTNGNEDELCDECQMVYGHRFASEL